MKCTVTTPFLFGMALFFVCSLLVGCNDKPTDIGSQLVPGTDTIFAESSTLDGLLGEITVNTGQRPIFNSAFVLYGKTSTSEARWLVEFVDWPDLGNLDSIEILEAYLPLFPQPYRFGDTNVRTLDIKAYELNQAWSALATWDSIWTSDGSSAYYSTAQTPVIDFRKDLTDADTTVKIAFDTAQIRRWMSIALDPNSTEEIYGLAFEAPSSQSIQQFRNLQGNEQLMGLHIVHRTIGDTVIDTAEVEAAVGVFINAPANTIATPVVQGAVIHSMSIEVTLDTLPEFAILVGSTLRIDVDEQNSEVGTLGIDELMTVTYIAKDGSTLRLTTRGSSGGVFEWSNITPILSQIRADGGKGTLEFRPTDIYEFWRMNRLRIHTNADAANLRPYINLVYVVPSVFQ